MIPRAQLAVASLLLVALPVSVLSRADTVELAMPAQGYLQSMCGHWDDIETTFIVMALVRLEQPSLPEASITPGRHSTRMPRTS